MDIIEKYIQDLSQESSTEQFKVAVKAVAKSNIPNRFFIGKDALTNLSWDARFKILEERGIDAISDIKNEFIEYLQDPCYSEFNDVVIFIVSNKEHFIELLAQYLWKAFQEREPEYLEYLFLVYEKCKGKCAKLKEVIYSIQNDINDKGIQQNKIINKYADELSELLFQSKKV